MVCSDTDELLAEIKKQMVLQKVQVKELATLIGVSQQSMSQYFVTGNPNCKTLFKICDALNIKIDVYVDRQSESGTES